VRLPAREDFRATKGPPVPPDEPAPATFEIAAPIFHSTFVCEDFAEAQETLTRLFGVRAQDGGVWAGRRAVFVPVGDVWVEGMIPVSFAPGRGSLANFLSRFGSHWHSLAWCVTGVQALADSLHAAGVRFFDAYGNLVDGEVPAHGPFPVGEMAPFPEGWESRVLFTSLRNSHGGLEFVEPSSPHPFLPPLAPVQAPDPSGLRITRCTHHTFAVADASAARDFWVGAIGADVIGEAENPAAGTRSVFVRFGRGGGNVAELAQPVGPGAVKRDLERCGIDMVHAAHFHVEDLAHARRLLEARGFAVEWAGAHQFMLDPALTLGARFGFTDRTEPPFL